MRLNSSWKSIIICLFIQALYHIDIVNGRKHHLEVTDDIRQYIALSTFGFYAGGNLDVKVSKLTIEDEQEEDRHSMFGLSLDKTTIDQMNPYLDSHQTKCLLEEPSGTQQSGPILLFLLDMHNLKVKIQCSPEWKNMHIYKDRSMVPTNRGKRHSFARVSDSALFMQRKRRASENEQSIGADEERPPFDRVEEANNPNVELKASSPIVKAVPDVNKSPTGDIKPSVIENNPEPDKTHHNVELKPNKEDPSKIIKNNSPMKENKKFSMNEEVNHLKAKMLSTYDDTNKIDSNSENKNNKEGDDSISNQISEKVIVNLSKPQTNAYDAKAVNEKITSKVIDAPAKIVAPPKDAINDKKVSPKLLTAKIDTPKTKVDSAVQPKPPLENHSDDDDLEDPSDVKPNPVLPEDSIEDNYEIPAEIPKKVTNDYPQLHICNDFTMPLTRTIVKGKTYYNMSFYMLVATLADEGLYNLYFHSCPNYLTMKKVSFVVDIEEENNGNYLSAGEMPLPALYFMMSILFFLSGLFWVFLLKKSKHTVFKIHYIMAILVFLKSISLMFHSINYYFIQTRGEHIEAWAILYYIAHLLKGALLFITIVLIGTGWTFIKHILSDKDKKIFMIVIPLQVLANVAKIIIDQSEESDVEFRTWRNIFIFVDLICCGAILFPIVWSIRHLHEASATDGKAAINLRKLKLFRQFYIMIVCYIYFTRIIVYLLKMTVAFQYAWLDEMFHDMATYVFFVLTGYKFRPVSSHPYFELGNQDLDDDEVEVLTESGLTEGLHRTKALNRNAAQTTTIIEGCEDERENLITKRESSHEYD